MPYIVNVYQINRNKTPLEEWLNKLDAQTRHKIHMKIGRLSLGNTSCCKSLGAGLQELKIDFGPGYRIYFSFVHTTIILLLIGGTKGTQIRDIEKAKKFLKDYKNDGKKDGKK